MNREPSPEYRKGKFDSARDEVLHTMALDLWGNESDGSTESPTGFFSRVSISDAELYEIVQAFKEQMEAASLTEPETLVGHFLVRSDADGFVQVDQKDTEEEAEREFVQRSLAYGEWRSGTA